MTYNPNATWTASTADKSKHPVDIVRIDDLTSLQYSSGPVKSPSRTTHQYLSQFSGLSQEADPFTGRITIGRIKFVLADAGGAITTLVSTEKVSPTLPTLLNRGVTILSGYVQDAESTYAPVFRGFITEIQLTRDGAAYEFACGDPKRPVVEDIFRNAQAGSSRVDTTLNNSVNAGQHRVPTSSEFNIMPGDYLILRRQSDGQEEKIQVRKIESGAVISQDRLQYSYVSGDRCRWASTRIVGNPINIFFSVMTGNFAHASFPLTLADGLPTGLGVAEADMDITQLYTERDEWQKTLPFSSSGIMMSFEILSPIRAKDWMEKQLFLLFGYPIITPDGKIGFHSYRPRTPTESVLALNETNIVAWQWERRYDKAVNRIVLRTDYDVEANFYRFESVYEDTANQATVGVKELIVEHQGLQLRDAVPYKVVTDSQVLFASGFMKMMAKRYLLRFMHGAPELDLTCHLSTRIAQLGEAADLTHTKIPDVRTGIRGVGVTSPSAGYEVIKIDHKSDRVMLLIQDNAFVRPGFIAPAGQADFGSATTQEKKYAYISPAGGGNFSDGTPPYRII
jgi:hypothetical protein